MKRLNLKPIKITGIVLFLFFVAPFSLVYAQDDNNDGAFYIVQPGDTLYSIASRFNTTVDEIVLSNGMEDANSLFVGQELLISSIDWADGLLTTKSIPLGETFRSLSRRYQIDPESFIYMADLVSPGQLHVGYEILLPIDNDNGGGSRTSLGSDQSLFELAVVSNINPWRLAANNNLENNNFGFAGDVFYTGGAGEGPGALPSPISEVSISPETIYQGKTQIITVAASGLALNLSGSFIDHDLNFHDAGDGTYIALQGVHVLLDPGLYPITITGEYSNGARFEYSQLIEVVDGDYFYEQITVDESYLDETITLPEEEFVAGLVAPSTDNKYWQGYFVPPHPYTNVINSYFGNRRSFNDSAYIYFHSGVDFGGGVGIQIFAPALGKVVYTGELTVRGYATYIDHGWGVYTAYFHQSEVFVEVGDEVSAGQLIGLVGNTGRSSGAHLHWEVWVGGVQVEPLDWLYYAFP